MLYAFIRTIVLGSRIFSGSLFKSKNYKQINVYGSSVLLSNVICFLMLVYRNCAILWGYLARAAGTGFIITSKLNDKILLKSKSGWHIYYQIMLCVLLVLLLIITSFL